MSATATAKTIKAVIPTRGLVFAETIESIQQNGVEFLTINGLPIPEAHNQAAQQALESGCEWVWFIEDDMAFPPDTLQVMLEVNAYMVCVDYPVTNGWSTIKRVDGEIVHCGLGCTLIHKSVFETMKKPWFTADKSIRVDGSIVDTPYKYGGHDIWFCRKYRQLGGEIKAVNNLEARHLRCAQLSRIESNDGSYQITALPSVSKRQEE